MMSRHLSFFTSPCKGEVVRRSEAKAGGWGSFDFHMTPSLTLPHSGGGNKKAEVDR
jgi:hypothetical protein